MFLFFVQATFAKPQCTDSLRKEEFVQKLDSIELDFVKADLPSIDVKLSELEKRIPCLSQRLLPEQAARYHILHGLKAWIADDEPQAKRSFAVAKRTNPKAKISTHAFPKEHFIHEMYAQVVPVEYTPVNTKPDVGAYSFDGYLIPRRPQKAPTIMQIVDEDEILISAYLQTDDPLLHYKQGRKYHKTIALGASAVAMVIGVGFQIDAQRLRKTYQDRVEDLYPLSSVPPEERITTADSLEVIYRNHTAQYERSFAALGIGSGILAFSYFLEW